MENSITDLGFLVVLGITGSSMSRGHVLVLGQKQIGAVYLLLHLWLLREWSGVSYDQLTEEERGHIFPQMGYLSI